MVWYSGLKINEVPKEYFTKDDCTEEDFYKDKIVILTHKKMEDFKSEYKNTINQIVYAGGGFGCVPGKIGKAVVVDFLDGETGIRIERYDILGVLKPEIVERPGLTDWCKKKES